MYTWMGEDPLGYWFDYGWTVYKYVHMYVSWAYLGKEFRPWDFDRHGADLDAVHYLYDLHVYGLLEALRV